MNLLENLPKDAVESLRSQDPISMGPQGVVGDAVALMQEASVGCVVIVEDGRPVGVFTERDVLTNVLANHLPMSTAIADVMTRDPEVISEGVSVACVMKTMHEGGFRHMPAVDGQGKLVAIVSVKLVVEYLVEHFPAAVFNLPPKARPCVTSREGA